MSLFENFFRKSVEKIEQRTEQSVRHAYKLFALARNLVDQGKLQESLAMHDQALILARQLGDQRLEASILNNMASAYLELGHPAQALIQMETSLRLHRQLGNRDGEALLLNNLGEVYFRSGQTKVAREHFEAALTISRELGDRSGEAGTLVNLGKMHSHRGELQRALSIYQQALAAFCELREHAPQAVVLANIGAVYRHLGHYQLALQYFQASLPLVRGIGNRLQEGIVLGHIADVHQLTFRYQDALAHYRQALVLSREVGDRWNEATTIDSMASCYENLGQYNDALAMHTEALNIARNTGDIQQQGLCLGNIGNAYVKLGEIDTALTKFYEALVIAGESGNRKEEGRLVHNVGLVHHQKGRIDEALANYERALAIGMSMGDQPSIAETMISLGRLFYDIDDFRKAREYLEGAIRVYERLRELLLTDNAKAVYFGGHPQLVFELLVKTLMQLHVTDPQGGYSEEAFHAWERSRSRALLDLLIEGRKENPVGPLAAGENEREQLLSELSDLQQRLSGLAGPELARELHRCQEIEAVLTSLESSDRLVSHLTLPPSKPKTVEDIQGVLNRRTVVLEYACFHDRTFLWVVSKDKYEVHELPGGDDIRETALELYTALGRRGGDYRGATDLLYSMVIAPASGLLEQQEAQYEVETGTCVAGDARKEKRVVIVPDRVLLFVPFEVLFWRRRAILYEDADSDSQLSSNKSQDKKTAVRILASEVSSVAPRDSGGYLPRVALSTNSWSVVYEPSATALCSLRGRAQAKATTWEQDFIGFAPVRFRSAPTLDHTEAEVQAIARLFDDKRVRVLTREKANLQSVSESRLGDYRYIHFATHGIIDFRESHSFGLLLSGKESDTLLNTARIMGLKLNADLVVASSCSSMLGQPVVGEGFLNLSRAFLFAGARTMCVSLWPVDDESTAVFMQKYYAKLRCGEFDKADALMAAKMDMLAEQRWSHPFHWAPFIIVGDWQ